MKKRNIKFTVIIPTRDRADTLQWALKTCTTQNYDNFEIIVSDNFSRDNTRQIVEAETDSRIRYLNTGKPLTMTANFEFALAHATGDYVCIIGDDDGLMPDALQNLSELLSARDIDAITWQKPFYVWRQSHKVESRNTLRFTPENESKELNSSEMLQKLLSFEPENSFHFGDLASLYHGFIKTDVINKLRSEDGRFFHSAAPDVYASIAVTSVIKSFWHSAQPFTMPGISQHSTGFASDNADTMKTFLIEDNTAPHPKIRVVPTSAPICVAECLLQAQKYVPEANNFSFDVKKLVEFTMREAAYFSPAIYEAVTDALRYTGRAYNIENYVDEIITEYPNTKPVNVDFFGYDLKRRSFFLKFSDEKVKNIYDATLICKDILERQSKIFYLTEASRYLSGYVKKFGFGNILRKTFQSALRS